MSVCYITFGCACDVCTIILDAECVHGVQQLCWPSVTHSQVQVPGSTQQAWEPEQRHDNHECFEAKCAESVGQWYKGKSEGCHVYTPKMKECVFCILPFIFSLKEHFLRRLLCHFEIRMIFISARNERINNFILPFILKKKAINKYIFLLLSQSYGSNWSYLLIELLSGRILWGVVFFMMYRNFGYG